MKAQSSVEIQIPQGMRQIYDDLPPPPVDNAGNTLFKLAMAHAIWLVASERALTHVLDRDLQRQTFLSKRMREQAMLHAERLGYVTTTMYGGQRAWRPAGKMKEGA